MPRKKQQPAKPKTQQKTMSYTMKPDVVDAINALMNNYSNLTTIHKTIDTCILNHLSLISRVGELSDKLSNAVSDHRYLNEKIKSFSQAFHLLTKNDLQYQQDPKAKPFSSWMDGINEDDQNEQDYEDDEI